MTFTCVVNACSHMTQGAIDILCICGAQAMEHLIILTLHFCVWRCWGGWRCVEMWGWGWRWRCVEVKVIVFGIQHHTKYCAIMYTHPHP